MRFLVCGTRSSPITFCSSHRHKSWEIILQLSGLTTSQIGDNIYQIAPGDILVIPPNTPHDGKSEAGYSDMYITCADLGISEVLHLHDQDGAVKTLMELLQRSFIEHEPGNERVEQSLLQTVCTYIDKYRDFKNRYPFVVSLKNTIYKNYSFPEFKISQAISQTGFHADYLRRCFREATGYTPLEYLTNMRLNYASRLLQSKKLRRYANTAAYPRSLLFLLF